MSKLHERKKREEKECHGMAWKEDSLMAWEARNLKDIRNSFDNDLEDLNSKINPNLGILKDFNNALKIKSISIAISNIEDALANYNISTLDNIKDLQGTETANTNTLNDIKDSIEDLRKTYKEIRE